MRETLKSLQSGRNKITNSKIVITSCLRINYWQRNAVFASIPLMSVMICNPRNNLAEPSQFSTLKFMLTDFLKTFNESLFYLQKFRIDLATRPHHQFKYGNVVTILWKLS